MEQYATATRLTAAPHQGRIDATGSGQAFSVEAMERLHQIGASQSSTLDQLLSLESRLFGTLPEMPSPGRGGVEPQAEAFGPAFLGRLTTEQIVAIRINSLVESIASRL